MSYLVLARRWRPHRFSEVVGQPHVTRTLLNSLRKGRIAHAYLFSGPRGVGKTTTARLLARALNCRQPSDWEPCGECDNCVQIGEGRFIDVIEIDAASNRRIDEIRQLREGVRYAPIEGKAKTYIIDEVHMLTPEAFNALLKTLEEPPEHSYFCLATTDPQKVPATIQSRCQRFDFRRVSILDIRAHLEKICQAEKIDHDLKALDLIARKADGSVRDSLSLLDQVIAFTDAKVLRENVEEVIGEIRLDLYFKAVKLISTHSTADAFLLDEELAAAGTDPQDFILGLEEHLMQILQVKTIGSEKAEIPPDAVEAFTGMAERFTEADLIRMVQFCTTAEVDIRRKFNPRPRLQLLLLKFATMSSSVSLADLIQKLESKSPADGMAVQQPIQRPTTAETGRRATTEKSSLRKQPEPYQAKLINNNLNQDQSSQTSTPGSTHLKAESIEAPKIPAVISDDPLDAAQQAWAKVCDNLATKHNSSSRLIKFDGYPVKYSDGVLTIRFSSRTHFDAAQNCQSALAQELTEVIGEVSLEFEIGELPQREEFVQGQPDDPVLKLLSDRLGARPVG